MSIFTSRIIPLLSAKGFFMAQKSLAGVHTSKKVPFLGTHQAKKKAPKTKKLVYL
jgi:hypothetical protein